MRVPGAPTRARAKARSWLYLTCVLAYAGGLLLEDPEPKPLRLVKPYAEPPASELPDFGLEGNHYLYGPLHAEVPHVHAPDLVGWPHVHVTAPPGA